MPYEMNCNNCKRKWVARTAQLGCSKCNTMNVNCYPLNRKNYEELCDCVDLKHNGGAYNDCSTCHGSGWKPLK